MNRAVICLKEKCIRVPFVELAIWSNELNREISRSPVGRFVPVFTSLSDDGKVGDAVFRQGNTDQFSIPLNTGKNDRSVLRPGDLCRRRRLPNRQDTRCCWVHRVITDESEKFSRSRKATQRWLLCVGWRQGPEEHSEARDLCGCGHHARKRKRDWNKSNPVSSVPFFNRQLFSWRHRQQRQRWPQYHR